MRPGGRLKPITVPHSNVSTDRGRVAEASWSVRLALAAIRAYQVLIRPLITGSCRYLPTCSEYAAEAIVTHGALRGGWLGLKRVLRCHPFGGAGLDPVP
jgi:putative membrane protein insertion efficiency factor